MKTTVLQCNLVKKRRKFFAQSGQMSFFSWEGKLLGESKRRISDVGKWERYPCGTEQNLPTVLGEVTFKRMKILCGVRKEIH